MPFMRSVRFGLIGYGAWGGHHARAIRETEGAKLAAIATRSEESRRRAETEHPGASVHADYQEMLNGVPLEAVCVVVPSHLHFEAARAVLEADRHVLLEKPMALSVRDCRELIQIARDRRRHLAVGHELRLSSLWGKVKALIDGGAVGKPLHALIELWRRPYRLGAGGWRYDVNRVGDWVLEEPIHFFDLARWYLASAGEPERVVAAAIGRQPGHPELHDNFSAVVHFPSGRYAVISQTLSGWEHHQSVKLTGTQGAMWARWSGATDRTFHPTFSLQVQEGDGGVEVPIEKPSGEVFELAAQVEMFVRAIREGTPVACTGEDACWAVAMCRAAGRSIESGGPISLAGEGP
jgi:myo-inositol 2-dehydrogenase/D-chiro-inositol 1-dehydrogenase